MKYLGLIRDWLVDDLKEAQSYDTDNAQEYTCVEAEVYNQAEVAVLKRCIKKIDLLIKTELEDSSVGGTVL